MVIPQRVIKYGRAVEAGCTLAALFAKRSLFPWREAVPKPGGTIAFVIIVIIINSAQSWRRRGKRTT